MPKTLALRSLCLFATALWGCRAPDASVGDRLYVTSGLTDELVVLDANDGSVLRTLSMDARQGETDEPHGVTLSPDGAFIYATLAHGAPTLWKFATADDRLVGRLELPTLGAARVGLTPDGGRAFVPDYWRSGQGRLSGLAVVDTHELELIATPEVCPAPHDAQVDPSGKRVAIACSLSDEVVVIDATSLEERVRFSVAADPGSAGSPVYKPLNLVWSKDGDAIYVTLAVAGLVRAFSPEGDDLGSVRVGAGPTQLALSPDGGTLVVANRGDASASIVDARTLSERLRVPLSGAPHPHGVVLDGQGGTAFISYEGTIRTPGGVVAVELESGTVLWRTEVGLYTLGVALLEQP